MFDIGNQFTGKTLKIVNRITEFKGVYGIHAFKVDTTPDDPDYKMLEMQSEMIKMKIFDDDQDNFKYLMMIKPISRVASDDKKSESNA